MPDTSARLYDGFQALTGGMDSGRAPEDIGDNQVQYAVNTTFRGGRPVQRPSYIQPTVGFDSTDSQSWFTWYRIQGGGYFNIDGRTPRQIIVVGGKVFEKRMTGRIAYVADITPTYPKASFDITGQPQGGAVDRNSMRQPKAWVQQAKQYCVIQDNLGGAIIWDGANSRRAGLNEVPCGSCMAFGFGRLIVAKGNSLVIGDIDGGPTNVITFLETTFLAEGGNFNLPAEMGEIVGMKFIAREDTSTGQGSLLVFAESGVASLDLSGERSTWKSSAIQQICMLEIGATSDGSLVSVNDDLLFRSSDGLRSYRNSQSQFGLFPAYSAGGNWGRTPISYEIKRILDYDTPCLLKFVSSVYFDNRLLMTVSPKPFQQGAVFRGMAVMDFVPVTSTRNQVPACFDGLWTGIQPVILKTGKYPEGDRCFAFCRDDVAGNQIWEITKTGVLDNDIAPIESVIETKSMAFQDTRVAKDLILGAMAISDLRGQTNFLIYWKPDRYPFWVFWCSFTDGQPNQVCTLEDCATLPNIPPQYRAPLEFPRAPETCDPNGPRVMLKRAFAFAFRIVWTGHCALERLIVEAGQAPQLRTSCRQLIELPALPAPPPLIPLPGTVQSPPVVQSDVIDVTVVVPPVGDFVLAFGGTTHFTPDNDGPTGFTQTVTVSVDGGEFLPATVGQVFRPTTSLRMKNVVGGSTGTPVPGMSIFAGFTCPDVPVTSSSSMASGISISSGNLGQLELIGFGTASTSSSFGGYFGGSNAATTMLAPTGALTSGTSVFDYILLNNGGGTQFNNIVYEGDTNLYFA